MDVLNHLEEESIYILREVAGQFDNPCLLFSGGKDSITLVRLAEKAFAPSKIPFPLVHVDTGHNFPETLQFRDDLVAEIDAKLIVGCNLLPISIMELVWCVQAARTSLLATDNFTIDFSASFLSVFESF